MATYKAKDLDLEKLGINNISPVIKINTHSVAGEKITIFGLDLFRALKVTPVFFSNFNPSKVSEFKNTTLLSILDGRNAFVTTIDETSLSSLGLNSIEVFANKKFEIFSLDMG